MYSNNEIKIEEEKGQDPSSSDNSFKQIIRESVTSKIIKVDDQSEHLSIFAKDPMAIIDNDEEPYFEYYSKAYLNDEEYIAPPPEKKANTTRAINNRLKLSTFLSPTPSEYIDQN